LRIKFGLNLDAGNWPEFDEDSLAVMGEVVLGPQGLLGLLEIRLGLGEEQMPQAIRIRRYMGRLLELDDILAFYSRSFQADAWAVARELLAWRDELIFYGWDPEQRKDDAPARLRDLAAIELLDDALPYGGFPDRFIDVLAALAKSPPLCIDSMTLTEPLHLLPAPWQALFAALSDGGILVEDAADSTAWKLEEVALLSAEQEWPLAQVVASWLQADAGTTSTAMLCQHESGKLDQALAMQGLPQTGQGEESAQKGILQLLPLVLENLWKPVRIEQLMALLSAPLSPVPGFAASRLIRVLARKPGLESKEWVETISEIEALKCKYLIKDDVAASQAKIEAHAFADDLDCWLKHDRVEIDQLAPADLIIGAVDRLRTHLVRYQHSMPMAGVAMGHCRDLIMILSDLGEISKALLDRIVDDVIGPGRSDASVREAACWGVIDDAAQLTGNVDTLIWWGFNDQSSPAANIWSVDEQAWLYASGVRLDAPSLERSRQRYHWLTSVQRCKRLLLCRTTAQAGSPTIIHPLWAEFETDPRLTGKIRKFSAMQLLEQQSPHLFGRVLPLTGALPLAAGAVTALKSFKANVFDTPAKLSPTSLGSLFGCSFKWLLEQLDVSASEVMNFQTDSALIGTLAHQVLEDIFNAGSIPDSDAAAAQALDTFDRRVPEMAAELLLPENRVKRADIRERVASAARDLVHRFHDAGFERLVCEEWIHTRLDGIKVNGRADVIAYNKEGEAHVIDFKYSNALNYYRKKIAKGSDIQLITYARMIDGKPKPVAYYLIPKQGMVTAFPAFGADTIEISESLDEGWNRLRKTFSHELKRLRRGEAVATGLVDEKEREASCNDQGLIYESPPCKFCDYAALCGLNGELTEGEQTEGERSEGELTDA